MMTSSESSYYHPGMALRSQSTTRHPSIVIGREEVERELFEAGEDRKFSDEDIEREIEALKLAHGGSSEDSEPRGRRYHKKTTDHIEHGTLRDRKSLVESAAAQELMRRALAEPSSVGDAYALATRRESSGSLHAFGGELGGPLGATASELSEMSEQLHPLHFAERLALAPRSLESDTAATVGEMDRLPPMDELAFFDKHKQLGTGTDAYVYEVVDRRDASHVAMKLTKRKSGRYRTEINLLNALRTCAFVVTLIRVLENDSVYVLILEQAPMTLEALLHERCTEEPMRESLAKPLISHVLLAVKAVNALGFVHKDIKPENVLIFVDSVHRALRAKLADFGFATRVEPEHAHDAAVFALPESVLKEFWERVADKCGTPGFWAPELVTASVELKDAYKMDVFSAGVCLYRMLCNEMPFGLFETWQLKEGRKLAKMKPNFQCVSWIRTLKTVPESDGGGAEMRVDYIRKLAPTKLTSQCISLIREMLRVRPRRRFTAQQCLTHEWLRKSTADSSALI